MKKGKIITIMLAASLVLTSCGAGNTSSQGDSSASAVDTTWIEKNDLAITQGVYYVDSDIAPGSYSINCSAESKSMNVCIFESTSNFEGYIKSDRSTDSAESQALGANCKETFTLNPGEQHTLNLQNGNVLYIAGYGMASLGEGKEQYIEKIYVTEGAYQPSEADGSTSFLFCDSASNDILVFENVDIYNTFEAARGENDTTYQDALLNNVKYNLTVTAGEGCYLSLDEDDILYIRGDGECEMFMVEMGYR